MRRLETILPTALVVTAGVVVLLYLGFGRGAGSGGPRPDPRPAHVDSTPVGALTRPLDTLPRLEDVAAHLDSLRLVLGPVGGDELAAITASHTLRQALPELRPYWLQFTRGRLRVNVAGQLVDDAALDRIRVGTVSRLRLMFEPREPHWVLRIDFR